MKTSEIAVKAAVGSYEEFISPNGIMMIRGIEMNWQKQFKYWDNTGPWSLFISCGSMFEMKGFMWKVNEDNTFSIFGLGEEDEDRVAFKVSTLEEAEFFIKSYLKGNNLELAPLYKK